MMLWFVVVHSGSTKNCWSLQNRKSLWMRKQGFEPAQNRHGARVNHHDLCTSALMRFWIRSYLFEVVPIRCRLLCICCISTSSVLVHTISLHIVSNSVLCRYNSLCFVLHRDVGSPFGSPLHDCLSSKIVCVNRADTSRFFSLKNVSRPKRQSP